MKISLSVLVTVFLFCVAASAAATVVEVTTRDETSDGPSRPPRRTLVGKKHRPTAAVLSVGGSGDACYRDFGNNEQACKASARTGRCFWYPLSATRGMCTSGMTCSDMGGPKHCTRAGCYWYPHVDDDGDIGVGRCSISAGVSCGNHRAPDCDQCPYYDNKFKGKKYCNGDCKWYSSSFESYCELINLLQ